MISPDQIEAVRQATDLVEVVSSYCTLKPAGRTFKGLCPFHREKTPSFNVDPDRQWYRCFGCGESGDVFNFVKFTENCDFPDAVRMLAERAGITLTETRESGPARSEAQDDLRALADAMAYANNLYQQVLLKDRERGAAGREYLKARGLGSELAKEWGIGFSPNERTFLIERATKAGYSIDVLARAGLAYPARDGKPAGDRFRGRVMFPIHDTRHRVVAFGGRAITPDEPAKYINTSETDLFHKSKVLYGLEQVHRARRENPDVRNEPIYVAEGYLDVMGLHAASVRTAVAPLGTALTGDHVKLLRPDTRPVVLVFDGDDAGVKAAVKATGELVKAGAEARVATLPRGRDPYDIFLEDGADSLRAVVERDVPAFDFLLDHLKAKHGDTVEGRSMTVRGLAATFGLTPDRVKEGLYIKRAAFQLAAEPAHVLTEWNVAKQRSSRVERDAGDAAPIRAVSEKRMLPADAKAEKDLLIAILGAPSVAAEAEQTVPMEAVQHPESRRIVGVAFDLVRSGGTATADRIIDRLRTLGHETAVGLANRLVGDGLDRQAVMAMDAEPGDAVFQDLLVGYRDFLNARAAREAVAKLKEDRRKAQLRGDKEAETALTKEILALEARRHLNQKDRRKDG